MASMSRLALRRSLPVLGLAAACSSQHAVANQVTISFTQPTLDRWNYPFNQSPGIRPVASIFGAFEPGGLSPDFDNRDAQFHVAFSTAAFVEPGLGAEKYTITAATLTMMVANNNQFRYEVDLLPWQSYLPPDHPEFICPAPVPCFNGRSTCCPNPVAVPPLELYGVGFRNGFTPTTFQETSPYSPFGPFGKNHRSTFAKDRITGADVSNNVDLGFDPSPLALGTTETVAVGALVPSNTLFTFALDVNDPAIQAYLRESVNTGIVHFMAASLYPASEEGTGSFPEFYTKENLLVQAGAAQAARLTITVQVGSLPIVGDLNNSGSVDVQDLLILLGAWGPCAEPDNCPADLNNSGSVDVQDLLILLANWG
ncbi:MAG TPA: hypothetical protein PK098_08110 [Phycisphaerales bacterium]|nr:hypothetical protein [Phycisphaerales bacterium]